MKRLVFAGVLAAVGCSIAFAKSPAFSGLSASVAAFNQPAPLYTTDQERLVSAIAGSILNIAAFADHFDEGDAFHVRNVANGGRNVKFSLQRRAEVFTVEVEHHVWLPRAYTRLARSFMADGAGASISEDPAVDRGTGAATRETLGRENVRLSRLLQAHPRSAALHERAALLLALVATERATTDADIRPLLCRMTAHLAVARALHGDALSSDGQLAERLLGQLADREAVIKRPLGLAPAAAGPVVFGDTPRLQIVP